MSNTMNTTTFNVAFSCKAPGLSFGEVIKVVGNSPSLGNNNLSRAVTLHTTPSTYPYYETAASLPLNATSFQSGSPELSISYQYALFTGGRFKRWETTPEPRRLDVVMPQDVQGMDLGDEEEDGSAPAGGNQIITVVVDVFSRPEEPRPT
eukprot:CAMPEP_0182471872 /NCGR_PEP_ID=MMETSP1319-20130603/21132_1 /TAXON_ID=172717 /ORGANISM="Bolidomonas pacifica, Strain RCC208" /LENGTH=149 /DNA_ID=CAMNT_0024672473 /DNA_START=297 /DNA_END=742 /DNA_ORIENTATION=-